MTAFLSLGYTRYMIIGKLPSFVGLNIGAAVLLLAMTAISAWGEKEDDNEAKFLQTHPGFHGFLTPHPPYPEQARAAHVQGKVQVKISFAAAGNVETVEVLKSSGSELLDKNTSYYIKRYWKNFTGKPASRIITLEYSPSPSYSPQRLFR